MRPQLPPETFATVVANAQLVSIDLLVTDERGRLLVGRRVNEPARGTWFVPGARVAKKDGDLATALHGRPSDHGRVSLSRTIRSAPE